MHFFFPFFFSVVQQSTQGAELNSEATLNCNGKEFKCVNVTHYQACSLTERTGQEPQYTINGVVLPCSAEIPCNDESSVGCAAVARTVPVETVATAEAVPVVAAVVAAVPAESVPAKSEVVAEVPVAALTKSAILVEVPVESAPIKTSAIVAEPAIVSSTETVAAVRIAAAEEVVVSSTEAAAVAVVAPVQVNEVQPVDTVKADVSKNDKKKSNKKRFGPLRLVNGFRAASWRPKISLESQKDVADGLRKRLFERRNKYEKFVDAVLGKANPVKQPAPGHPLNDDYGE